MVITYAVSVGRLMSRAGYVLGRGVVSLRRLLPGCTLGRHASLAEVLARERIRVGRRGDRWIGTWKVESLYGGSRGVAGSDGGRRIETPSREPSGWLSPPLRQGGREGAVGRISLASSPFAPICEQPPLRKGGARSRRHKLNKPVRRGRG